MHKESKNTSKLPKFLSIHRKKNKHVRKLFSNEDDTWDKAEKVKEKVGDALISGVKRGKRKIMEEHAKKGEQ